MNPLRILILEDDPDIIDLLRSVLEPTYECLDGQNGLDGLQLAILGEPDLVICDIMMPVMDGREFIRRLREMPGFDQVPVIFLSALGTREQIQDGYQLGAALYVTKPIDPARFRRNLELFVADHGIHPRPKRRTLAQVRMSTPAPARSPVRTPPRPAEPTTPPPPPERHSPERPPEPPASLPLPRLLVVEDDADASRMIRIGLSDQFEILEAGDGVTAIEMAVRYKPDLFVIDGMLPRMTGYQLTMMLRKNRTFFRTPIVFISGKATPRDRQYVQSLGISAFLPKPFTVAQLREKLTEIVKQPSFTVNAERLDLKRVQLEQFQQLETHRSARTITPVEHVDRTAIERALRAMVR